MQNDGDHDTGAPTYLVGQDRAGRWLAMEAQGSGGGMFPSREAAMEFAADPDYAPFGEARKAGSISNFYLIDDTDVAGTIPYLGKG